MRIAKTLSGLVVVAALLWLVTATRTFADDWTLPRGNPQLTSSTPEEATLPLSLAWEYQTHQSPSNPSQPVVVGNLVAFATGDRVNAVDAVTGGHIWSYPADQPLGSQIKSSLAAYAGRIYFGANDGSLYCISASDGHFLWAYATQAPIRSSPMVVDGSVFIGSDDRALHKVDAQTGNPLWYGGFHTHDDVTATAAVDSDGWVYIVSRDTYMYASNPSGKPMWSFRIPTPTLNIEPVLGQDSIYLAAGNLLVALGPKSGMRKWSLVFPSEITAPPAFHDQVLYVALQNKTMYAITAAGKVKWPAPVSTVYATRCSPTVAGNVVFVGADKGVVSAFDTESGQLKWRYVIAPSQSGDVKLSANNNIVASPVWANGALYVLPDDGTLRAFQPGAPDSSPPNAYYLLPAPGEPVSGSPPLKVSAVLTDQGSGVDESSIVLALDGNAVPQTYDAMTGTVSYTTPYSTTQVPLADGRHTVLLTAKDWKGNEAHVEWSFVVDNTLPKPRVRAVEPKPKKERGAGGGGGEAGGATESRPDTGEQGRVEQAPPPPPMPPTPGGAGGPYGRRGYRNNYRGPYTPYQ